MFRSKIFAIGRSRHGDVAVVLNNAANSFLL